MASLSLDCTETVGRCHHGDGWLDRSVMRQRLAGSPEHHTLLSIACQPNGPNGTDPNGTAPSASRLLLSATPPLTPLHSMEQGESSRLRAHRD
ncbi:unnamed protein product [Arctogadus glacialis]